MTNQNPSTVQIVFFNAQTASANSTSYSFIFPMKRACVKFWGTWDGASVKFQTLNPLNTTDWIPVDDKSGNYLAFTSDGQVTLENVVYGDMLRCVLSGAGGSTSLNVTAQAI